MKKIILLLTVIFVSFSTSLFAQRTSDIDGGKDYPLVSRFKGSVIEWYDHKDFDNYYLLELKDRKLTPKKVAGDIVRIQYSTGKEHSIVEISQSYKAALKNAGFNITLSLDEQNSPGNLNEELYFSEFNGLNKLSAGSVKPDHNGKWRYMEAMGQKDGKDIFIVVYITNRNWPLITFDAVEVKKIASGLVTAKNIDSGLSSAGHIALAGIYFDTGKSTIKPESDKALKNIAEYLKSHPGNQFLIVGHTDNIGNFESNINLSSARAMAVVKMLTGKYGIKPGQLRPYGIGFASPVASNLTDSGRSKNRRVELVER